MSTQHQNKNIPQNVDANDSTSHYEAANENFTRRQIYIVTGAGRGIGRSIAESLVHRGARVLALDIAFEYSPTPDRLDHQICDVSSETSVQTAMARLGEIISEKEFLMVCGLVNCAGVVLEKPLLETTIQDIQHVLGVNLQGPILCTRDAVRLFQSRSYSEQTVEATVKPRLFKIVNIASELAHLGREDYSVYCASKAAIIGLTRSWAREFAPQILVNAVAPGPVDTKMLQSESNYAAWKDTAEGIPLGRIGQPEDIASAVCFLLNPAEANFMTGSVLNVNGGAAMY